MISAPKPPTEAQRLAELRALAVLDTPTERAFDAITSLLARTLQVPIVLVSLVDEERQWFKSHHGLDARETSRDIAFCAHAILGEHVFEVPDASQDERFADNPLVTQAPSIRFYAGAPLETSAGHSVGTLCAIDREPRELNDGERLMLRDLSEAVVALLEVRRTTNQLQASHERLQEMAYAVGHDVRAPIRQSGAFMGLARKGLDANAEASEALAMLDRASECNDRAQRFLADLMDYAKQDAPLTERHSLGDIVREVQSGMSDRLSQQQVLSEGLPDVIGNRTQLLRLFQNLLDNAHKYAVQERPLRVEVSARPAGSGLVEIAVKDNGQGIPDDSRQRVFELFYRLHKADGQSSGVGLALCRRIVEDHGGTLRLESEEGQGTTFLFTLPAAQS